MKLHEVLRAKGREIHTIGSAATLDDVVTTLVRRRIGALVVCDEPAATESPHMLGIITERDLINVAGQLLEEHLREHLGR